MADGWPSLPQSHLWLHPYGSGFAAARVRLSRRADRDPERQAVSITFFFFFWYMLITYLFMVVIKGAIPDSGKQGVWTASDSVSS